MEVNVIKLAFLLSYLTMLICLFSGIPFMTALFRAVILMVVFSCVGLVLRWYYLKLIGSIQVKARPSPEALEEWESTEQEEAEISFAPAEEKLKDMGLPPTNQADSEFAPDYSSDQESRSAAE